MSFSGYDLRLNGSSVSTMTPSFTIGELTPVRLILPTGNIEALFVLRIYVSKYDNILYQYTFKEKIRINTNISVIPLPHTILVHT